MNYFTAFFSLFLFACSSGSNSPSISEQGQVLPYNLNEPDVTHVLPKELVEISGLSDFDDRHVACVQDELGIIYIIQLASGEVSETFQFEDIGDFEGITFVDPNFYVLRSDGRLTLIPNYRKPTEHQNVKENIPTKDNEGLCYDATNHRLIIAAKSKPKKESNLNRDDRLFYQFDLTNSEFNPEPLFKLGVEEIREAAEKANIQLPVAANAKKFNFRPSSIAVHPESQNIYILSAADFLLAVCDAQGKLLNVHELNPQLFPKAEGITFLNNGTMIIANEGVDGKATLLIFE